MNKETTTSTFSIPVTPIVYESIEIERPVQTDTKRENRRSRRINKKNTEPKITQQQNTNQAQNSKIIQVPDSEQAINTPPVVIEDGKHIFLRIQRIKLQPVGLPIIMILPILLAILPLKLYIWLEND